MKTEDYISIDFAFFFIQKMYQYHEGIKSNKNYLYTTKQQIKIKGFLFTMLLFKNS